jgi:DNA modification methylase
MLIRCKQGHRTLYTSKSLLTTPQQAYIRPKEGKEWWGTTTTVWRADEIIGRGVRNWKRLMGETGHTGTRAETMRKDHDSIYTATHSVFPAPLAEWILLRYAPEGGHILDAFAGGPPRSVVASIMGHRYTGFEIRQDQIDENENLLKELKLTGAKFILGDARLMDQSGGHPEGGYDCAFTCPPYWNLEQYSDDPADLSNFGTYDEFNIAMAECAAAHYPLMKPGAFVCIVVGPFRNKKTGELIDFPAHTTANFRDAGFLYWQQIVLIKNFASAAVRSTNAWRGHKLVPTHEFLLVFKRE